MREVDLIKEKIEIVDFIGKYIPLKRSGRNFRGLCPFHSEKTPSFFVSDERQAWHCFGACNEGGDVISFFMKIEGLQFYEALVELSKQTGVPITNSFQKTSEDGMKERLRAMTNLASEYYHYILVKHKLGETGRLYLKNRGVSDKLIKTFMLGYAPNSWNNLSEYLSKKGFTDKELILSGLSIEGNRTLYDRFRGRVIFTLFDHRNNPVGFSGRVLTGDKEAKYINSPESPIYHKSSVLYGLNVTKDEIRKIQKAVVTEGEFDVLSSYANGISNVVAIKGTAFTEKQLILIKRYASEIILCLDMDIAGNTAARQSIEKAQQFDIHLRVVQLTKGKDIDEALHTNPLQAKKDIVAATPIYDYIIQSAVSRYGTADVFARDKIAQDVLPLISSITNAVVQNHYIRLLSRLLEVSEESIENLMEQIRKKSKTAGFIVKQAKTNHRTADRQQLLEDELLAIILQSERKIEFLQHLLKHDTLTYVRSSSISKIIRLLEQKKSIPSELTETYNKAFLMELSVSEKDQKEYEKRFLMLCNEIKKLAIRRKLPILATNIQKGDETSKKAQEEFNYLTIELKNLEQSQ
jgi:DNA primase